MQCDLTLALQGDFMDFKMHRVLNQELRQKMETDGWVTEFRSSLESHTECISQLSHHRNLWFSYLKKRHRDANDSLRLSINCGSQTFRDLPPKRQLLYCSSSITCQGYGYDMTLLFPLCQCSLMQSMSRVHLQSFLRDHKA